MSKKKVDISKLEEEYLESKNTLDKFNEELTRQIKTLLSENDVLVGFPIQNRTKTLSSIKEKISSGRFNVKKTLYEMNDLVGLRIILIFKKDVELVSNIINKNFDIIDSYNTIDKLGSDKFGYSSHHFVIKFPDEWLKVPSTAKFASYKAEIQVRTVAQHLWAEVSNHLQYKQESSVPNDVKRTIYRASALLELIDFEFDRVLDERKIYIDKITTNKENIEEILNVDSLAEILDENLPKNNKDRGDYSEYGALLGELENAGFNHKSKLLSLITKNINSALEQDKSRVYQILDMAKSRDYPSSYEDAEDLNRANKGAFYTFTGLIRRMLDLEKEKLI